MRQAKQFVPWVITAVAVVAVVVILLPGGSNSAAVHPAPRSDVASLAQTVRPASFVTAGPRAARAYQIARQIPTTLDGLYCYCQCRENFQHRSLLTCFQSSHGEQCDICIQEAEIALGMLERGGSLADIRTGIDEAFGS